MQGALREPRRGGGLLVYGGRARSRRLHSKTPEKPPKWRNDWTGDTQAGMLGASMFPVIFMMSLLLAAVSATGAEAAHGMVACSSWRPMGVRVLKEGGNAICRGRSADVGSGGHRQFRHRRGCHAYSPGRRFPVAIDGARWRAGGGHAGHVYPRGRLIPP